MKAHRAWDGAGKPGSASQGLGKLAGVGWEGADPGWVPSAPLGAAEHPSGHGIARTACGEGTWWPRVAAVSF